MHDFVAITKAILDGYVLPWRGTHGVMHWARVWANGLRGPTVRRIRLDSLARGELPKKRPVNFR